MKEERILGIEKYDRLIWLKGGKKMKIIIWILEHLNWIVLFLNKERNENILIQFFFPATLESQKISTISSQALLLLSLFEYSVELMFQIAGLFSTSSMKRSMSNMSSSVLKFVKKEAPTHMQSCISKPALTHANARRQGTWRWAALTPR